MRAWMFLLIGAMASGAAEDGWTKVSKIKSGTEVRIVRDGARQPVVGKFDEAREDSLLLVVRNEQIAIPRAEIERVDARPTGSRVKTESKTTQTDPDTSRPPAGPPAAGARPSTSSSSGLSIGPKPDFEVVYRRPPKKK